MGETTAVLRTSDRRLAERVRRLCALAGLEFALVGPGAEPPRAAVLLDDRHERVGQPWRELVPDVIELGTDGLRLPQDAELLLGSLAAVATPRRARVIGFVGAGGGLGTSVLAAVVARLCVAAGHTTALVDLDPAGGGVDVVLGTEHDAGPRWADVLAERGGFPPDRLMGALPSWHGVRVLSSDVRGGAGAAAVGLEAAGALTRAADVVVLDLPRGVLGPGADRDHLALCDDVVLLAGCDTRAAAAAAAAATALTPYPVRLVVRGPAAGALHPEDVAEACGLELTVHLRPERAFTAGVERGLSPGDQRRGPLRATGQRLLRELQLAP